MIVNGGRHIPVYSTELPSQQLWRVRQPEMCAFTFRSSFSARDRKWWVLFPGMNGIKLTVDAAILQLLYYEQFDSCQTAAAIIHMHYQGQTWKDQPWTCLCFGFSQMILILPFLLITLHLSHIGFTEDLTFMRSSFLHQNKLYTPYFRALQGILPLCFQKTSVYHYICVVN